MLLRELVAAPRLRLRLLHEGAGGLDRPVGRAVTTDLLEPSRYLSGGELVISGLVWRRSPEDSERFVASLVEGGAAALAAGDALLGSVPDDLVEACRRHDVTLLEVPVEVAFADLTEYLAAAQSAAADARLSTRLARQRQLLSAIVAGRSLDELAARVSADIGHPLRVLTATGRHVVAGPGELPAEVLDRLTLGYVTADRLPTVVRAGDERYSLFPVGSALGSRLVSWLVAVAGPSEEWPADTVEAVNEFAAVAALDRSRRDEGLRSTRPFAQEALALVESGAGHHEVAARLRQAGLPTGGALVAVVAGIADRPELRDVTRALVEDVALEHGQPVVALGREGTTVALLPATPTLEPRLRAAFGRLAPGLTRARLAVGLSGPSPAAALAGALEEARFAHRLAQARSAPVSVVSADEVTSHVLLLATVPDDVRRTFANRVLGRVLDYDRRNSSDLVATLEAFMACSGSWSRTAEALHVHVNTVRYRVQRVEELTGRDLSRLEDRVDVFLALRSLEQQRRAEPPPG